MTNKQLHDKDTNAAGKAGVPSLFFRFTTAMREPAARFFNLLPALALGLLCLRAAELTGGLASGIGLKEAALITATALGLDLLSLARYLPVIFLLSFYFLRPRGGRASFLGLGLLWSALLLLQAILVQYFFTAGVPLGSDLLAYTLAEIIATIKGGGSPNLAPFLGLAAALAAMWWALASLNKRKAMDIKGGWFLAAALLLLVLAPRQPNHISFSSEYARSLALNKTVFFADDIAAYLAPSWLRYGETGRPQSAAGTGFHYLNAKYPFLHSEQTPDVLGPYFRINAKKPPNLVFIIVEGLGRAFSGPGAILGSFTPKLDQLAANSLYWENFLATQGRTFGVLPSLLASLPFGANGLAELGERMPPHISLLSLLKTDGYREKVYYGFKADFDNDRIFYTHNGVDTITDELNFGPGYKKSNSWGYSDGDLVSRVLAGEAKDYKEPFITIFKTSTMHTPYTFNGQNGYYPLFEKYLDRLGIPEKKKKTYRQYRNIYTSILYLDDELARFFTEIKKNPAYADTIFIITGDHRLPEIPMATRIDRYHVPLIIFSPLLKTPARIKSVSSQFDVTPSLLAFLSHNYGIKTPGAVTWVSSGLDMDPSFRNVHTIPMKQTKTNLLDFISGSWYVNQDTLYKVGDSMTLSETNDRGALGRLRDKFEAFRTANDQLASSLSLMPEVTGGDLIPYREEDRVRPSAGAAEDETPGLAVREVRCPENAKAGNLSIEVIFSNPGDETSATFLPLVVLMTDEARELTETYGQLQQLPAGGKLELEIKVKSRGIAPGRYFLAVIPSHPQTGKSVGAGKYRIPVRLTD